MMRASHILSGWGWTVFLLAGLTVLAAADFQAHPASNVYEFLYVFNPVPIKGASGSLGVPLAIR